MLSRDGAGDVAYYTECAGEFVVTAGLDEVGDVPCAVTGEDDQPAADQNDSATPAADTGGVRNLAPP